jgi:serine/threonine protein kinase
MKQGDLVNVLRNREIEINGGENNTNSSGDNTKPPAYTLLSDLELWNIFHQVVKGIAYLHYQNIVHGDIKPQVPLRPSDF